MKHEIHPYRKYNLKKQTVFSISAFFFCYPTVLLTSIVFLIPTILIYTFLPELRNLHGKCLVCYMLALLVMYTCLIILKIYTQDITNSIVCIIFGYVMYDSMWVAFFFLNVISFDIYSTFKWVIKLSHVHMS